jgi:tetratricopeptide (TPR) repeat protein
VSNKTSISYDYICDCALGFFNKYLKPGQWKNDGYEISFTDNNYIQPLIQNNSSITELCNLILSDTKDIVTKRLSENQALYAGMENEISILSKMLGDKHTDYSILLCSYNVANHPNSWQAYFDLANAHMRKGELGESRNALLKAQELNPENTDISKLLDELNQQ